MFVVFLVKSNTRSHIVSSGNCKELRYVKLHGEAAELHIVDCKGHVFLVLSEVGTESTKTNIKKGILVMSL